MDMSWDELCARAKARPATATEADVAEFEQLKAVNADLAQELAFTRKQLEIAQGQIAAYIPIAQEAAELRAALEPLAGLDIHAFENIHDGRPVLKWGNQGLTLGDVRRAKRALGVGE